MPPFIEMIVIIVVMMSAFFLVFLGMFLLALFLAPIERGITKLMFTKVSPTAPVPQKESSFKDFSKKH